MLEGKRVLIVDDNRRNILALTSALERYRMITAGRGGIEALKNNTEVDVVLMDIMMPEINGFETIRTLRLDPKLASLPIIGLTAKAMKAIERSASHQVALWPTAAADWGWVQRPRGRPTPSPSQLPG